MTQKNKSDISFILLACCTCKRPLMLRNCLDSINNLIIPNDKRVEILVIDNDKNMSAQNTIEDMSEDIKFKINYFQEPKAGLAYARNRLLEEAIKLGASHILLFDDDEVLSAHCLKEHIKLYMSDEHCFISSGMAINHFDENVPRFIKSNILFKRKTSKKTGMIKKSCATDNVFFPIELIKDDGLRFSHKFIFMGGEDIDFFTRAQKLGYTIMQNSRAIAYEYVTKIRTTVGYILRRAYFKGYCGSFVRFRSNENKKFKNTLYLIKLFFVFLIDILLLIPSILLGLTIFLNMFVMTNMTLGKIAGAISKEPIDFYKNIAGE